MKSVLAVLFAASLTLAATAQEAVKPPDLAATLTEAENLITSTNTDLAGLRTDKWSAGWKAGFGKKGVSKQQVSQTLEALKTMSGLLPAAVVDVRTAHGSVGSAFKLYNQLTQVTEALDALAEAAQTYGKKEDYARLSGDCAGLQRVRGNLSAYVEQRASVVDPRGNVPSAGAAAKKDDAAKKTVAKHVVKKKSSARTSD